MRTLRAPRSASGRRGGALVAVTFLVAVLATLSFATLALSTAAAREQRGARAEASARYLSAAGLSAAVYDLRFGGEGVVGSADAPVEFAGGEYFVERFDDGDRISLVSTGRQNGSLVRTQLVVRGGSDSFFLWGAFGEEGLVVDQNATVDSYDSSLGTYEDQATNGSGGHPYANTRGHIGSNGSILMRQNSRVYGDAVPGPGRTTTVTGNAILSGASTPSLVLVELPPVVVPEGVSQGPLVALRNTSLHVPPGTTVYGDLSMESRSEIVVQGPAKLVFDDFVVGSNASFLVDSTGGPVEIYVQRDFVLNSNALVASLDRDPLDLAFFLTSDNILDPDLEVDLDEVDFNSNSMLFGTVYAPRAAIDINSNFKLYGAVVARRLLLRSYSQVHYDENLAGAGNGSDGELEVVGWRILPDRGALDGDLPPGL